MTDDPFSIRRKTMVRVNLQLLGAAICAASAWFLWPTSPEWWGFGALSIIVGLQVPVALVNAVRSYLSMRSRERAVARYMAQGGPLKSATTASRRALVDAGMIDD